MRITRLMTAGMFVAALAAAADAQTVSLTSKNGTMTLTGKLIELDDEQFHIRTEFGNMWVARDLVTCAGTGCPGESGKVGLIIHGSDTMGKDLMPMLVEGYVDALGTHVATRSQEGSNTTNLHIKDNAPDGRDVAIGGERGGGVPSWWLLASLAGAQAPAEADPARVLVTTLQTLPPTKEWPEAPVVALEEALRRAF
ncbi:MAG: hypothetical protein AAFV27_01515, partial [Pseudomonadota bacterium]